jgi:hypothetical protein
MRLIFFLSEVRKKDIVLNLFFACYKFFYPFPGSSHQLTLKARFLRLRQKYSSSHHRIQHVKTLLFGCGFKMALGV